MEQPALASSLPGGNGSQPPSPKQKKINPIKLREMEQRRKQLEEDIAGAEHDIAACEQALQVFVSVEESQRQTNLLEQRRRQLAEMMEEWEEVSQALEAAT
jgi:ATP-binding cassette subfamily F protein 3